jgi:predicted negative regulator of RcsB-dependent stress response
MTAPDKREKTRLARIAFQQRVTEAALAIMAADTENDFEAACAAMRRALDIGAVRERK